MAVYYNTLTRTDTHTLASLHIDDFKGTQSLHLDGLAVLQSLKDDSKHLGSKAAGLTGLQAILLCQDF